MGDLLSVHLDHQMAAWGLRLRGSIKSRQRCPVCGAVGKYAYVDYGRGRRGLLCQCGGHLADLPYVEIRWQNKSYRITHDQQGRKFAHYREAEQAQGIITDQIERREFYPELWASAQGNRFLWENYIQDYLGHEEMRLMPDQAATFAKKKSNARHLAWFNGRNIKEIRTGHVEDFAALPCLHLALGPKSRADLMGELRSIFKRAVRRDDIKRAPAVPSIDVPESVIVWMNPDQQARALEQIPQCHRPIFMFMFIYGCRVSEACALCWDRVDMANGVFHLSRIFSRRVLKDKRSKTKRPNALPITNDFEAILESMPTGINDLPVFRNPEADPGRNPKQFYTDDALNKIWRQALQDAGLEHISLMNATRHSRGMQAVNLDGWNLEAVRRLLGHTSQAHTRKYAQADVRLLRELMDKGSKIAKFNKDRQKP